MTKFGEVWAETFPDPDKKMSDKIKRRKQLAQE